MNREYCRIFYVLAVYMIIPNSTIFTVLCFIISTVHI